ncbi:MAG: glycosyltransferase family 4 protein [Candidatus Omnitrophica bacterium]|nr:glycosyltransferase family 4 protein [Candidatus Omnitrophota bacterium]
MSRVLLHSLVFSPDSVSTSYIITDLALELKRLGHDVTVLTTTPHYNIDKEALKSQPLKRKWLGILYYSQCGGIPVWHVKIPMKGSKIWVRGLDYVRFHLVSLLVSLFLLKKQDIIIANSPPLTIGIIGYLLALRWGARSIYVVQELYPDIAISRGVIKQKILIDLARYLEKLVYRWNTRIVTITEQFKKTISTRGVLPGKISFIPNGVDCEFYCPLSKNKAFLEANGLIGDFVVLYAGNIGLMQDWESVVFAAQHLSDYPIKFVVVGDGIRRKWLEDRIEQLNLKNIILIAYQPKQLMPLINASADITMIPMTRIGIKDGFPSKIYASFASAKPVIVSADIDSEMEQLIEISGCGRAVPPENNDAFCDAVLRAFNEKALLVDEGMRGRAFVLKHYSKQASAAKYNLIISELTGDICNKKAHRV